MPEFTCGDCIFANRERLTVATGSDKEVLVCRAPCDETRFPRSNKRVTELSPACPGRNPLGIILEDDVQITNTGQ